MIAKSGIIFKPDTNRLLYILLLIATPFLLLQNYLQSVIGELSAMTYEIGNVEIPVTVTIAIVCVFIILYFSRKKITKTRIIGWLIVITLFWIGQKSTDYYFNHKFYELQYNWHYFAYAIFAYINYRALQVKNATPQKVIIVTFLSALAASTLDEFLQMPLSNRIFDVGDISKDLWGAMIGLFVIFVILENGKLFNGNWRIQESRIKDYFNNPVALIIFLFVLSYIFMVVASLLTETRYITATIAITSILFLLFFLTIHISQKRKTRIIVAVILSLFLLGLISSYFINHNRNITYNKNKILVYKGIPLIYFDVLIHPDGMFRFVDKKEVFNKRDQQTIYNLAENIIIIGTGNEGVGGKGFLLTDETQFVYSEKKNSGIQIIIQENNKAIETYNRLAEEKKRPMLIYHNN